MSAIDALASLRGFAFQIRIVMSLAGPPVLVMAITGPDQVDPQVLAQRVR